MKSNIGFYINLIEDLLANKILPEAFERVFPYVFNRDNEINQKEYKILNRLFMAAEDFVSNPEIRDDTDIDEDELKKIAKEVLEELKIFSV